MQTFSLGSSHQRGIHRTKGPPSSYFLWCRFLRHSSLLWILPHQGLFGWKPLRRKLGKASFTYLQLSHTSRYTPSGKSKFYHLRRWKLIEQGQSLGPQKQDFQLGEEVAKQGISSRVPSKLGHLEATSDMSISQLCIAISNGRISTFGQSPTSTG